jgi:two-component system, NarL family, nitrate/nitrite response regulator NarL
VSQPLSRPIRVFVADSSPISGQLLADAIARDAGIDILGFSSDPTEVSRIILVSDLDILVVSARMQEDAKRGMDLLKRLRAERPALKAVVLLDSSKPEVVVEAFRSGASGIFSRNGEILLLRKCIVAVHRGQIWASSEELAYILAALSAAQPFRFDLNRVALLSAREKQVVRSIVEGLTNREIAERLTISRHTVKNYVFKIFDKLGVSNRVELVFQVLSASAEANISGARRIAEESDSGDDSQFRTAAQPKHLAVLQPARISSPSIAGPYVARAAR